MTINFEEKIQGIISVLDEIAAVVPHSIIDKYWYLFLRLQDMEDAIINDKFSLFPSIGQLHAESFNVQLTKTENKIIYLLAKRMGSNQLTSKSELYNAVFKIKKRKPETSTINTHFTSINKKLKPAGLVIKNIHSRGFFLDSIGDD